MAKKIKLGDVVIANRDISGFMFNIADQGTEGIVVGLSEPDAAHVAFRGNTGVFRVETYALDRAKSYKIKAKKLGLGMRIKIKDGTTGKPVWAKLEEVSFYGDGSVYAQGENKTGQSYYEEFKPNALVEVKS